MEALLDAADALVRNGGDCPPRPDFPMPEAVPSSSQQIEELLELKDSPTNKGKGWFARVKIVAGTVLIVAKPLAMAMDYEEDDGGDSEESEHDEDDEDLENHKESKLNTILLVQILEAIKNNPRIWSEQLSGMFPRTKGEIAELPAMTGRDPELSQQINSLLQGLENIPAIKGAVNEIFKRLPFIIRYNALSVETCPELLSYPGSNGHASLGGVGLYHLPSFFNHNSRPNVSRWAVGDVMWFVANQDIEEGTEVCISYVEHDVLCESAHRRTLMLQMDFDEDGQYEDAAGEEEDGPAMPVVDAEVQNELMGISVFERLDAIDELLLQAQGLSNPEDSDAMEDEDTDAMETPGPGWFNIDIQNLQIIKAITLEGLGQSKEALELWTECVNFTESKLPPIDESSVAMQVQAALCSLHIGETEKAKMHAQKALYVHDKLFGGGVRRLRRRYQNDFKLSIRPASKQNSGPDPVDVLWPL